MLLDCKDVRHDPSLKLHGRAAEVGHVCAGLLHTDFMHLAGSLLPWAVLCFLLEVNYGSIRVFLLCLASLVGGAFTSAVLDPSCQVVGFNC